MTTYTKKIHLFLLLLTLPLLWVGCGGNPTQNTETGSSHTRTTPSNSNQKAETRTAPKHRLEFKCTPLSPGRTISEYEMNQVASMVFAEVERAGHKGVSVVYKGNTIILELDQLTDRHLDRIIRLTTTRGSVNFHLVDDEEIKQLIANGNPDQRIKIKVETHRNRITYHIEAPKDHQTEKTGDMIIGEWLTANNVRLADNRTVVYEKAKSGEFREIDVWKAYVIHATPVFSSSFLLNAVARIDHRDQAVIDLELTQKAAKKFSDFTANNIGKKVAIIINGEFISAPVILEKISGGRVQISMGREDKPLNHYKELAFMLKTGSFPCSLDLISKRDI